jgi:CHAD domain-containing protein
MSLVADSGSHRRLRVSFDYRAETHWDMEQILEREDKWDVDERFVVPDLGQIVDGATVAHDTVDLTSTYFDTDDGDLRASGILIRRREGDDDCGWQVKLPAEDGRIELHWPLSDRPPAELTNLLNGVTSGRPLSQLATIRTKRERYRISTPARKAILAELVDDHVRASVGDRLLAWRELEVELGSADTAPKRLIKRLVAAGARPSRHASKLEHAVSFHDPAPAPARDSALAAYLKARIDQIIAGDVGLRRRQEPIHDTRVAIRRLRSSLRVFRAALDQARIGDVDAELKWFAALLGEVRDCQVQQRRFTVALEDIPDEMILGPVHARIQTDLRAVELPARTRIDEAMSGDRYLALMAMLRRWRTDPPLIPDVEDSNLVRLAHKAARKADKRLASAISTGDGAQLHRARKAAKRARYAAELVEPLATSKGAKRTKKHHKRIQSILGDHQDTVVARAVLRRMAAATGRTADENGFTFGLLYAREGELSREARREAGARS